MSEIYHEEMESSKDDLSELKKEAKNLKEKIDTVDNVDKWANKIFDKATKIKPDKFKKPGLAESTDAYAGYTRKRGNTTYELREDYGKTLIIKEPGKKDCSVAFGRNEVQNKTYIVLHDQQGETHNDKEALPLAKKYVTQFKNALKISN